MGEKKAKGWGFCVLKDLVTKFSFLCTDKIDDILIVLFLRYCGNYCEGGGYYSLCDRPINGLSWL